MNRLPEVKTELKTLVGEGLDAAIKRAGELLSPDSLQFNQFIQIKSRYSAYLSAVMLGAVSKAELDGIYNQISLALLLFIDALKPEDLKPEPGQPGAGQAKRGELLYHIPHRMQEQRDYRCAVRVAYLKDLLFEGWQDRAEDVQQSIRVAEVMSVELFNADESEPFAIRPFNEAVQFLDPDDFTEWIFMVRPRRLGEFPLVLRVSVLEMKNGREVKKDVVIEAHVVVTTAAPEVAAQPQFVRSGMELPFSAPAEQSRDMETIPGPLIVAPASPAGVQPPFILPPSPVIAPQAFPGEAPPAPQRRSNTGLRAVAVFLALLIALPSVTWALTPPETRDWWQTRYWNDTEQAYQAFMEKYPASEYRETALYRKSEVAPTVQNLRAYLLEYAQTGRPAYRVAVAEKLKTQEGAQLRALRENPSRENVRRYLSDFPDSERLSEVRQALDTQSPGLSAELLPLLEAAYVRSMERQLTPRKWGAYQRDFPRLERLNEVAQIAAAQPAALPLVQAALDAAIVQKIAAAATPAEVLAVLPALESAGSARAADTVAQIAAQNRQLNKETLARVQAARARAQQRAGLVPSGESMSPEEQLDWAAAEASNKSDAFVAFAEKYPQSNKFTEARARIEALKSALPPEERAWADAVFSNTPAAYINFYTQYPGSKHAKEARRRIQAFRVSLKEQKQLETEAAARLAETRRLQQGGNQTGSDRQPEAATRADDDAWQQAQDSKNYQAYLDEHPQGRHVAAAKEALDAKQAPHIFSAAETVKSISAKMKFIPGGTFQMGGDGEYDGKPIHSVTLKPFYISKTEVTFDEYDAYCAATGRAKAADAGRENRPVVNVSWYEAVAFCNWLSEQSSLQKVYSIKGEAITANWRANGYRLPTEAEWEYAARGGASGKTRYAGSDNLEEVAWHRDNADNTHPVGQKKANAFGLFDMSGNVWEWCWDRFSARYPAGAASDPSGPDAGSTRVLRGGSWSSDAEDLCVVCRSHSMPGKRNHNTGFRFARAN